MSTYVFTYRAPRGYDHTDGDMQPWRDFFGGIGQHLLELGQPVSESTAVGETAGDTVLSGYSLVTADSLPQAAELAAACPLLQHGGGVEIGELAPVPE